MSDYTKALAELVALPGRLDEQLAQAAAKSAAERKRSEREIDAYVEEQEAVLAALESTLDRARRENVVVGPGHGEGPPTESADPLDLARQLVGRLKEALDRTLYTRRSLAAAEAEMSEEEKRRAAEARRRREREQIRREEAWERARQGDGVLIVALAGAGLAGLIAGFTPAAAVVVLLAAVVCAVLAATVTSSLPARAVTRATGSRPDLPSAPPRQSLLAGVGYAGAALSLAGLGAVCSGLLTGAAGVLVVGIMTLCGVALTALAWLVLPRWR